MPHSTKNGPSHTLVGGSGTGTASSMGFRGPEFFVVKDIVQNYKKVKELKS
jgi:hypothetical protein